MGVGFKVECTRCKYKKTFFLGSGMMLPRVYKDVITDVKAGKYGEEWKDYISGTPGAVVSVETELYQCRNCNYLLQDYNLSLYVSNNEAPPEHGYWAPWCDHDYSFVKSYPHKCPKCRRRMHKVSIDSSTHLSCPECGSNLEIEDGILWD